MIPANVVRELQELDNADLERAVTLFIRAALMVAVENHPLTASGDSGRTGKPGSRPPGRQQCPGAVKRLCDLAQQAGKKAFEIRKVAERGIETMGGIRVTVENGKLVGRRKDGTYAPSTQTLHERMADRD